MASKQDQEATKYKKSVMQQSISKVDPENNVIYSYERKVESKPNGVIFAYFKWTYGHWKRKSIPYIEPVIPFGSLGNLVVENKDHKVADAYNLAKSKGWKYCGVYMFLCSSILIVDIGLIKRILATDFQYFVDRGVYINEKDDPTGCHIFALKGTKWKNMRAKLSPIFSSGRLKGMLQTLVDRGVILEKNIKSKKAKQRENGPVDIKTLMQCFSTDVISSCGFGLECNAYKDLNCPFVQITNKHFSTSLADILVWLLADNFPNLSRFLGVRQVNKDIAGFFKDVVENAAAYREKNNCRRNDFLQQLLDMKVQYGVDGQSDSYNSLTMVEIASQCLALFVAGSETTATTLTFALFELATHPEIQERLRDEILTVLARHDGKITYDSLGEMSYMGQVINETLRIHPPISTVERECVNDYRVLGEDFVLEKGTKVVFSLKALHYDEEYWKNPKEFDPERFSEENRKNVNQFAFLPFGQGPRACVAERFALLEAKVGLTSVLRRFKVGLNKKTKLPLTMSKPAIVASLDCSIWLDIEKI